MIRIDHFIDGCVYLAIHSSSINNEANDTWIIAKTLQIDLTTDLKTRNIQNLQVKYMLLTTTDGKHATLDQTTIKFNAIINDNQLHHEKTYSPRLTSSNHESTFIF